MRIVLDEFALDLLKIALRAPVHCDARRVGVREYSSFRAHRADEYLRPNDTLRRSSIPRNSDFAVRHNIEVLLAVNLPDDEASSGSPKLSAVHAIGEIMPRHMIDALRQLHHFGL